MGGLFGLLRQAGCRAIDYRIRVYFRKNAIGVCAPCSGGRTRAVSEIVWLSLLQRHRHSHDICRQMRAGTCWRLDPLGPGGWQLSGRDLSVASQGQSLPYIVCASGRRHPRVLIGPRWAGVSEAAQAFGDGRCPDAGRRSLLQPQVNV